MNNTRNYLIHPHIIFIYLILGGISVLFLAFSASFMYNRIQAGLPPLALPSLFYFNTLLLIGSSFTLRRAKKKYLQDDTQGFKQSLLITLILSFLFLGFQIIAWYQLVLQGIHLTYSNMASYLYVISFIHMLHLIGGIPFLAYFYYIAIKKMKDPVSVLVYFSDDTKARRLKILSIYWHFLDYLWVYLVIFFLINYLIK